MKLGEKVRKQLAARRMSQDELASAVNTTQSQVSKWLREDAKRLPPPHYLVRISRALGVSIDYLVDDEQEETGRGLSDTQARILWLAEQVGYETAIRRITVAPESKPLPGESYAEIRDAKNHGQPKPRLRRG